jgi:hypothetical protein
MWNLADPYAFKQQSSPVASGLPRAQRGVRRRGHSRVLGRFAA